MSLIRSTIQKKLLNVCIGGMCLLQTVNAQDKLYPNAFALQDVQLLKGPFQHARDLNIQTLLQYDTDRLLAGYRKEAGLPAKATIFANWEGLDGHVGGHYLSALAMNYAATGNAECKRRMEYMISELKQCMEANAALYPSWAVGYVGAVPNGKDLWPKIKEGDASAIWKYWVPWYNVHKMYAGLKDAWMYAGDEDAKKIELEDMNGNKIIMNQDGITIESIKEIKMKAATDLKMEGGANVNLKGGSQTKVEGGAGAEISSGGATNVKGSIVNLN